MGNLRRLGRTDWLRLRAAIKQKAQAMFADARKKLDATWGDKPKDEEYFSASRDA